MFGRITTAEALQMMAEDAEKERKRRDEVEAAALNGMAQLLSQTTTIEETRGVALIAFREFLQTVEL